MATPIHLRASVVHLTYSALNATAKECGVPADVFDDPDAPATNRGGEASRAQIEEAVNAVRGPAGANPTNNNPYNATDVTGFGPTQDPRDAALVAMAVRDGDGTTADTPLYTGYTKDTKPIVFTKLNYPIGPDHLGNYRENWHIDLYQALLDVQF